MFGLSGDGSNQMPETTGMSLWHSVEPVGSGENKISLVDLHAEYFKLSCLRHHRQSNRKENYIRAQQFTLTKATSSQIQYNSKFLDNTRFSMASTPWRLLHHLESRHCCAYLLSNGHSLHRICYPRSSISANISLLLGILKSQPPVFRALMGRCSHLLMDFGVSGCYRKFHLGWNTQRRCFN